MTTPAGHRLGNPARYTNGTLTVFHAECECGTTITSRWLWRVWEVHAEYLGHVKAESMRSHPSRKDGAA